MRSEAKNIHVNMSIWAHQESQFLCQLYYHTDFYKNDSGIVPVDIFL